MACSDCELPPSPSGCVNCNPNLYTISRLNTWKTAYRVLKDHEWDSDESIGPADVLLLAMFLEGVSD